MRRFALSLLLVAVALSCQGCLAVAVGTVAGTAIGVTGEAVGVTAKAVGATARAIIPGDSRDDRR